MGPSRSHIHPVGLLGTKRQRIMPPGENAPEQRHADPAAKAAKESRSSRVAAMQLVQGEGESLLSTDIAIEFDLHTKQWNALNGVDIPWIEQPRILTKEMIQNAPIKGRHSKEEKDAERKAEEILRTPGWVVSRSTPLTRRRRGGNIHHYAGRLATIELKKHGIPAAGVEPNRYSHKEIKLIVPIEK